MRNALRIALSFAMLSMLTFGGFQPLSATGTVAQPQQPGGSVTVTCTPPSIVSISIVWNPDGSGTRTTIWTQSCTTCFTDAGGNTSCVTQTHTWPATDTIPAPTPTGGTKVDAENKEFATREP